MQDKEKKRKIFWIVFGLALAAVAAGLLISVAADETCSYGPAMCSGRRFSADLGIVLSVVAFLQLVFKSREQEKTMSTQKSRRGLLTAGSIIIASSVLLAMTGLISNRFNNNVHVPVRTGDVMMLFAVPIAIVGIITVGYGMYSSAMAKRRPKKESHSALFLVFAIGIALMLLSLFL